MVAVEIDPEEARERWLRDNPPLDPMTIPDMRTTSPSMMTHEQIDAERQILHQLNMHFRERVDRNHPRFQAIGNRDDALRDEMVRRRDVKGYGELAALAAAPGIALGSAWAFFKGRSVYRYGLTGGVLTVVLPVALLWFFRARQQRG
jgi:hypothetical protein